MGNGEVQEVYQVGYMLNSAMLFLLLFLTSASIGGVETAQMAPYVELTWPPPGHVFVAGEPQGELYCVITFYDLTPVHMPEASFEIKIIDAGSQRHVSAASGALLSSTERQQDGGYLLHLSLEQLQAHTGRYELRAALRIGASISSSVGQPFRIQQPLSSRGAVAVFPKGTPGEPQRAAGDEQQGDEGHKHLVIALVRMRNSARSLRHFLRALSMFVHRIIILDDGSVDASLQIAEGAAEEFRVASVLRKQERADTEEDAWADMQRLLEEGRRAGGTHFVVLHTDEVLSTSWLHGLWWQSLRALDVGESLSVPWVHFWKSLRYARADWMMSHQGPRSLRIVDVAFRDDGRCRYKSTNIDVDTGRKVKILTRRKPTALQVLSLPALLV